MNILHLRSASILCGMAIASAISGCVTINNYYPEQSRQSTPASTVAYAPPQGQCSCGVPHDVRYGYYPQQEGSENLPQGSCPTPTVVYVPQYYPDYPAGYYPPVYAPQPPYRRYPTSTVVHSVGEKHDTVVVTTRPAEQQGGVAAHTRRSQPDASRTTDAGHLADITAENTPRRSGSDRIDLTKGERSRTDENTQPPVRTSGDADRIDVAIGNRSTAAEADSSTPRRTHRGDSNADRADAATAGEAHQTAAETSAHPSTERHSTPVSATDATALPGDATPATAAPVEGRERRRTPQTNNVSTTTNTPVAAATRNTTAAPVVATPRKPVPAEKGDAVETKVTVETQANPAVNAGDTVAPPVENVPAAARSRRSGQK